jgi:hypothetical protein
VRAENQGDRVATLPSLVPGLAGAASTAGEAPVTGDLPTQIADELADELAESLDVFDADEDVDATARNRIPADTAPPNTGEGVSVDVATPVSYDDIVPLGDGGARPTVRPAAVARPVTMTSPGLRPRRPSEEGPPTTMPPPTRRR